MAWFSIGFPSLVLNYAGQSALVLNGSPITDNSFYVLCPRVALVPFVILATAATIIASQAIITGAFSMTRQAIQLAGCRASGSRTPPPWAMHRSYRRRELDHDGHHHRSHDRFPQIR